MAMGRLLKGVICSVGLALSAVLLLLGGEVAADSSDLARWLGRHATPVSAAPGSTLPQLAPSIREGQVILLGEVHGLEHGQVADIVLLQALHRQAGVRTYVGEFDAAQADAFNHLLETGQTEPLDRVFQAWRRRGLQWANEEFRAKLLAIAAWNATLPARQRIRFAGVDEIQDRVVFCRWLHARIPARATTTELARLRSALGDQSACAQAGELATAALHGARGLDITTRDGIAALAVHAAHEDREARIAANIERQLEQSRGRMYGLWGLYHTVQARVNGTEPMALQLVKRGVRVRSIAILNLDGQMMIPVDAPEGSTGYGTLPYTVDNEAAALVNGIEVFAGLAREPLTLFTLHARGSPFRGLDILSRVDGAFGRMQPFAIDIASAPSGYWTDAVMISRQSPPTKPLGLVPSDNGDTQARPTSSACELPSGAPTLPLERGDSGSPVVTGRINGRGPFAFVLDTGAGGTSFPPSVAADLALPAVGSEGQAGGLGGTTSVRLHAVASLEIGPFSLEQVTLPSVQGPQFDSHPVVGLAGIDLFTDQLIWWDLDAMQVVTQPSGSFPANSSLGGDQTGGCWEKVAVSWMRPWRILLPISVNGVAGMAMLDTGAQQTIINPAFAQALVFSAPQQPAGEIMGIDGTAIAMMRAHVEAARIGPWHWDNAMLHIADLAVFDRMGPREAPLMILGMDWLAGRRFAIDYGRQEVWLGQ